MGNAHIVAAANQNHVVSSPFAGTGRNVERYIHEKKGKASDCEKLQLVENASYSSDSEDYDWKENAESKKQVPLAFHRTPSPVSLNGSFSSCDC